MTHFHRTLIALMCVALVPLTTFAEAPVVDESDNFAIYDENQADAYEQPLAKDHGAGTNQPARQLRHTTEMDDANEQPLAREGSQIKPNHAAQFNQLQSMQKELQELRGQLEMQSHELKLLKEQQLNFYKDLDARIQNPGKLAQPTPTSMPNRIPSETTTVSETPHPSAEIKVEQPLSSISTSVTPLPASNPTARSNNPAEEQIYYLAAFDLIKNRRFDEAIRAMQAFVHQYPKSGYAANAYYWLGELYMTQKDYPHAITNFDAVLQQFPSSSKAAPSMLKSADALASSGKKSEAIQRLKLVITSYPDTHTAKLADRKLKTLNR
jgi:tol-pal system protein YbgF